jgi:hypothetical protein
MKSTGATNKQQKKPRGREPTPRGSVHGVQIAIRLSADEVAGMDAWIERQRERFGLDLSRPAALRAFMKMALKEGKG